MIAWIGRSSLQGRHCSWPGQLRARTFPPRSLRNGIPEARPDTYRQRSFGKRKLNPKHNIHVDSRYSLPGLWHARISQSDSSCKWTAWAHLDACRYRSFHRTIAWIGRSTQSDNACTLPGQTHSQICRLGSSGKGTSSDQLDTYPACRFDTTIA